MDDLFLDDFSKRTPSLLLFTWLIIPVSQFLKDMLKMRKKHFPFTLQLPMLLSIRVVNLHQIPL